LQKVLIARALITNPNILILDEPTTSLDAKTKNEIIEILKELSNSITIILVTHELNNIKQDLDKIIYINRSINHLNTKSEISNYELVSHRSGLSQSEVLYD
jgi:zinc transport system ATP-binding protein